MKTYIKDLHKESVITALSFAVYGEESKEIKVLEEKHIYKRHTMYAIEEGCYLPSSIINISKHFNILNTIYNNLLNYLVNTTT